jgi:hypothetical protein
MPDLKASELFAKISNYMNFYSFYREELRTLEIQHGRKAESTGSIVTPREPAEELTERVNYWVDLNTDKVLPPESLYIDNGAATDERIRFDFSRTLIADCVRVFASTDPQVPVLWTDGDPLNWSYILRPPAWVTKANLRILRYNGQGSGNYRLTYGGSSSANYSSRTQYPMFVEPDVVMFHTFELRVMEGAAIEIIGRVTVGQLYDQTMFKQPVWVEGYGVYWLDEATQMSGDIYKLKLIK